MRGDMIQLHLDDIPVYKPSAKPLDHHDCEEAGCYIPSQKKGLADKKSVNISPESASNNTNG
jgi:hypothetical protein